MDSDGKTLFQAELNMLKHALNGIFKCLESNIQNLRTEMYQKWKEMTRGLAHTRNKNKIIKEMKINYNVQEG